MMNSNQYVVLDTNIWVYKTRLLNSGMGAAILYSLHKTERVLVLPEVIEEEIKKHTVKIGKEAAEAIKENYCQIEQLMGKRDDFSVPSEAEFSSRVDDRFLELETLIKRIPFTLEHAKSALKRVMEETPPNGRQNQQFKDSAIWEAILDLAKEGNIDFITEDKAFFKNRDPKQGLAENLKQDCEILPGIVRIYYELSEYLKSVERELPPLDDNEIAHSISSHLWEGLNRKAIDKGYELNELVNHKISAFYTEKSNILAINFQLSYCAREVIPLGLDEKIEAIEIVEGNCTYNFLEKRISDVQLENIYLKKSSGEKVPGYGWLYSYSDFTIGRSIVPYVLREPMRNADRA